MSNNPFADLESATTATATATKDPKEEKKTNADAVVMDDLAELFGDFEIEIGEADHISQEPTGFARFIAPVDKTCVPVRITEATYSTQPTRVVIVRDKDGKAVYSPAKIDEAVDKGAEQEIVEVPLPQFKLKLELLAECYNPRPWPYLLSVTAMNVRIAFKNADASKQQQGSKKKLGFDNTAGLNLIKAAKVAEKGSSIKPSDLEGLTPKFEGKIVMAQIKTSDPVEKTVSTTMMKEDGKTPVKARVAGDDFLKIVAAAVEDGKPLVDDAGTPVPAPEGQKSMLVRVDNLQKFTGNKEDLIENAGVFYLPDDSEDGAELKVQKTEKRTYDNLNSSVAPVPEREVQITRCNGEKEKATITLDTIGLTMPRNKGGYMTTGGNPVGTIVQALTEQGELVTVSWIGTQWAEKNQPHEVDVSESGVLRILPVTLPGQEAGASDDAFAVFKGDK